MDQMGKVIETILDLCTAEQLEVFADKKIWQIHLDELSELGKMDADSEIMTYLKSSEFVKATTLGQLCARAYRRLDKAESFEQYITGSAE